MIRVSCWKTHPFWLALWISVSVFLPGSYGTWACGGGKCVKEDISSFSRTVSVEECKITCLDQAGLWPQPRGLSKISRKTVEIDLDSIKFYRDELPQNMAVLVDSAQSIFLDRVRHKSKVNPAQREVNNEGRVFKVVIRIEVYDPSLHDFITHVDESYTLKIRPREDMVTMDVKIVANNFFGARHGLETLAQLIVFDDLHKVYKMIEEAEIKDSPYFTHRGILLDTARSYIGVKTIETILDLMAMNKLNTFHWHITDSQSFPYVSTAFPQLSQHGAYSQSQVYTPETIRGIVQYARVRGIRVIPEFDAPAHVGEGWEALNKSLITCFKWEPWRVYCVEPPCGQFDPTNDELYSILGTIFKEYVELFPSDLFHMGGDEVSMQCWKSTPRIVNWMKERNYTIDSHGFHKLWVYFQDNVYTRLKNTKTDPHPKPILWTSTLTDLEDVEHYLSPQDYTIQIWTERNHPSIKNLLQKKYQLIFSNYDELYLDCGGPSWVGEPGMNWCSPYKNWQIIYNHSLTRVASALGMQESEIKKQILGSEVAVWTEQIDDSTVLSSLWPRSSALAERLWSNQKHDWKEVQYRMNYQRQRINDYHPCAELLQPQWCYQNDGYCS